MSTRKNLSVNRSVSFKSAGEKIDQYNARVASQATSPIIPIGIKTPLQLGSMDLFETHTNIDNQIKDNFRNLILTQKGERLGNPEFGTTLRRIQYESAAKEEAELAMMATIQNAAKKYMPFIELADFSVEQEEDHVNGATAILILRITYSVPRIGPNVTGLQMVFPTGV